MIVDVELQLDQWIGIVTPEKPAALWTLGVLIDGVYCLHCGEDSLLSKSLETR